MSNRIRYLGAVNRTHSKNGLLVVGIVPGSRAEVERYAESQVLGFELLGDEDLELHHAFRTHPGHGHSTIALFDREGRVKYHAFAVPDEDAMRQLVEKYLVGRVDYGYRTRRYSVLRPGTQFPTSAFSGRAGGKRSQANQHVDARNRILAFLPPGCSSCQLSVYASNISKLRRHMPKDRSLVLVLPAESQTTEWTAVASDLSRSISEVWFTTTPDLLWDNYYTRYSESDSEILVVITDSNATVEVAGNLSDVFERGPVQ